MKKLISIICCVAMIFSLMVTLTACELPQWQEITNQIGQVFSSNNDGEKQGLSDEFKEAMDSYEQFVDEYVAFMKKCKENPTDLSLLTEQAAYIGKLAERVKDFEAWGSKELTLAERAYFVEVQIRVAKKLLEVTQ